MLLYCGMTDQYTLDGLRRRGEGVRGWVMGLEKEGEEEIYHLKELTVRYVPQTI